MRKWTKSARVVLAWGILLPLLAAVGSWGSDHPAQASTTLVRSTKAALPAAAGTAITLTAVTAIAVPAAAPAATWTVRPGDTLSGIAAALDVPGGWAALYAVNRPAIGPDPDIITPGMTLRLPGTERPARYTVAPGDTLAAIAAALAVPGGWPALYAANRPAIGPDPGLIRPGTVLTLPRPAVGGQSPPAGRQAPKAPTPPPPPAHPKRQAPPSAPANGHKPTPHATAPSGTAATGGATSGTQAAGMPRWLETVLLSVGLLIVVAFTLEPLLAIGRRRAARSARPRAPGGKVDSVQDAIDKARIVFADYERLIITYSASDRAVYVLSPPGENPRAVLRAARLILPEDAYQELAGVLGEPSAWPLE